ncbi:MAG: response regulator [Planctomycetota bacterium]
MKWQQLDKSKIHQAIELYLELAYDGGGSAKQLLEKCQAADCVEDLLAKFFVDEKEEVMGRTMARYSLRLGNRSYPNMKLVLHEYLVRGEFFFSVDTHDQIEVKPGYPDYEAWIALKQFNAELKCQIEDRWQASDLPTLRDLRCVVREEEQRAGSKRSDCNPDGRTVLVVDDEPEIIDAVEELLCSRGFAVVRAINGDEAVELAHRLHPDLILMDYQMPKQNGIDACACLKDSKDTQNIPVLLATACSERIEKIGRADGFLVKPYEAETLIHFVQHHLRDSKQQAC